LDPGAARVWLRALGDPAGASSAAGRLCLVHADSLSAPRGWVLEDHRDAVPRLFRTEPVSASGAPARPRAPRRERVRPPQLFDDVADAARAVGADADRAMVSQAPDDPVRARVPVFDRSDDLDGLLSARGPLLSRAFGAPVGERGR
jgi:hypothetical protein